MADTDQSKRDNLAHRMSKLLGLPLSNIQMLMPWIPKEDVDRLSLLPDDQFLSESAKVINVAQRNQYEGGDSAPAADPAPPPSPAPDGEGSAPPSTGVTLKDTRDADVVTPVIEIGQGRPGVKFEDAAEKKKKIMMIAGAGAAALLVIGAGVFFVLNLMQDADTSDGKPSVPKVAVEDIDATDIVVTKAPKSARWALKVGPRHNLTIENPEIFNSVDEKLTVEMWIKPIAGKEMVGTTLMSTGSTEAFRLSLKPNPGGNIEVEFFVNGANEEYPDVIVPRSRQWMHVAGVFDASVTRSLRLYIDGALVAEFGLKSAQFQGGYKLVSDEGETNAASLIDEVRLSASARYTSKFVPARIFEIDDSVISLLHLEKRTDNMIVDSAFEGFELERSDAHWVDISMHLKAYEKQHKRIEFPADALARIEKKFGSGGKKDFLKEWDALSNSKRRAYLKSVHLEP